MADEQAEKKTEKNGQETLLKKKISKNQEPFDEHLKCIGQI